MRLPAITDLLGRILFSLIFLISGFEKLANTAASQSYMASAHVPPILAIPAGIFELGAGLALIVGWQTRATALLLSGFCLLSGVLFHMQPADQMQMVMFMKNIAMAGGFLILAYHGAGPMSLDARNIRR